ncbi:alpha/beta-hydrolase [Exidia glandulosa HHB12029]|uniref:Alpha/beta-hydrolase n=1 Tax=Exidia glandulosa HHB12029 TaxID=1314781 RepID=A0A165FGR9_EXIGL|nr:alpha/beta-hydrolase [Exidia glandulosa HHB12029]
MSLCKDCIVVARHEGTPAGALEIIGGVETYVSIPPGEYDRTKAVLFLTDIFGHSVLHAQLLADDFARAGFQTYVPGYLNGDPVSVEEVSRPGFDVAILNANWVPKHTQEHTRPVLDAVIAGLKERGVTTFGSTGYCFGGRFGIDLAISNVVVSSVIAHPWNVDVPDFVTLRSTTRARLLVLSCEDDFAFPLELQAKVDEALKGWGGYERKFWKGCKHGFAVRADPGDEVARKAKEEAFEATVEWFRKSL